MSDYRPDTCAYCYADTWCETRSNGKPQCRACKVERFFERVLYAPFGYHLQKWGRKVLRDLYGTVRPDTGLRQYRKGYISTGKQNGKSFIVGGLPIYHLLMEDELSPQAYGVASAKDQAGIVFEAAAGLVQANPDLQTRLKVLESTKRIVRRDGGGLYCVLSADGDVQDGKRPSLLIFDELHRFARKKAETVRTVLVKGMISRAPVVDGVQTGEPLMLQVTTSGDEHESPLWASEYEYAQQIISGGIEDPTYYAVIYQADAQRIQTEQDYWKSREARVAANPSHQDNGGFLADSEIEQAMLEAVRRPEKYHDYVRLNLNVPVVSTGTPVVNMPLWCEGSGGVDLRQWPEYDTDLLIRKWNLIPTSPEQAKRRCFVGVDLAWKTDLTAMACLFPPARGQELWHVVCFVWVPEEQVERIENSTRVPLRDWIRRGFVQTAPGPKMELETIEKKIRWAREMFGVREVCFDPWGGLDRSAELLAGEGFTCTEIEQKIPRLTHATKEFLALHQAKKLIHGNNPVLNWNVSCLALDSDHNDNVKPAKPKRDVSAKRIDLVSATINAGARAFLLHGKPVYRKSIFDNGPVVIPA